MSGDLTARDVIAEAMRMTGAQSIYRARINIADEVLAALAAAGWRLERDDKQPCEPGTARCGCGRLWEVVPDA